MPEGSSGTSIEDHSILLVGTVPSTFTTEDEIRMLRSSLVRQWSKHDLRDDKPIPSETRHILIYSPEVPRHKMPILQGHIKAARLEQAVHDAHTADSFKQKLKSLFQLKPPLGSPGSNGHNNGASPAGKAESAKPSPENGNGAAPKNEGPKVKLPPSGEQWKLPDFIRANANPQAPKLIDEATRVLGLCLDNGYPDAKLPNVEQHIRKMRGKLEGTDKARGSGKALTAVDNPIVNEFLQLLSVLASNAPVVAAAINEERANYKARIKELEDEAASLKGQFEIATQAAELLQRLKKG